MKNTFGNLKSTVKNVDIVPVQFYFGDKTIMIDCICTPFLCSDNENQNLKSSNGFKKQWNFHSQITLLFHQIIIC